MIYGIIPARLESTRLPRKLLLAETGKPLIQHTWESVCRAKSLDAVIVATDSEEIAAAVRAFGGRVEMTGKHNSGTDRVAEVAGRIPGGPTNTLFVNIQGDEPDVAPAIIDDLVRFMLQDEAHDIGTLATPLDDPSPDSIVKVVRNQRGSALYFSRRPVPNGGPYLRHIGVYAFRKWVLPHFANTPMSSLEQSERLEQLRWKEWGVRINVVQVDHAPVGIDTPEDYRQFVERHR